MKISKAMINEKGRPIFINSDDFDLKRGMGVIIQTKKSLQYCVVVTNSYNVEYEDLGFKLSEVVRISNSEDDKIYLKNKKDAYAAFKKAQTIANQLKLDMNIIDAEFNFERTQLLFNFVANSRIDFRDLAKKLAQIYKTRIELRQIGVRDRAKELGWIGPCGRFLCCSTFLTDFNTVTINMAKNQMLALNPSKINGVCGRLLCCISYEDDIYTEIKSKFPKIGEHYNKNGIDGKVIELNIFNNTFSIETKNKTVIEVNI